MHRIATALLIAAAVVALNGSMLRDAFAVERAGGSGIKSQATDLAPMKSAKVLSLLLILEALRQSPVPLTTQKV